MSSSDSSTYNVFIAHAERDRGTIAIPLRDKLRSAGITAFIPDAHPSRDAERAITAALLQAKVAIIILSPEFIAYKWPMKELLGLLGRLETPTSGTPRPVIIPFYYRLTVPDVFDEPRLDRLDADGQSLYRKSRFLERMSNGEPEAHIPTIKLALRKLQRLRGVQNDLEATNDAVQEMSMRCALLLQKLVALAKRSIPVHRGSGTGPSPDGEGDVDEFRPYYYTPGDTSKLVFNFTEGDENQYADSQEGKLLRALEDTSPEESRALSVYGMGGVGKTSILRGISTLDRIKRRFKDGVHLISLAMEANERDLISALSRAVENSGGRGKASKMRAEEDWTVVMETFQTWFRGKQCLFLVDDVWQTVEMSSSMIHKLFTLHVSGRDSKVLVSTRSVEIASREGTCIGLEPWTPLDSQARAILVRYSGIEPDVENSVEKHAVNNILDSCCGLPLFMAVAGSAIRTLSVQKGCGSLAYDVYAKRLSANMQECINTDVVSYQRLRATLSLSLELIEEDDTIARFDGAQMMTERYRRLSVLEKQEQVPLSMLRHLWELKSESDAEIVARKFEQLGLVKMEIEESESRSKALLSLHDSMHLFALTESEKDGSEKGAHDVVLKGYGEGLELNDGCRAWWSTELKADGYIHERVCRHLLKAGHGTELVRLLLRPLWTVRQFEENGLKGVLKDYSLGVKALDEGAEDVIGKGIAEAQETLRLVAEATSLSSPYVDGNMRQLWFQLYGRLNGLVQFVGIKEYLDRIEEDAPRPWLRCLNPFLKAPRGMNTRTISLQD